LPAAATPCCGICPGETVTFGAVFARVRGRSMTLQWLRSGMRSSVLVAAVACGSFASTTVTAQQPLPQGHADRGKAISYTCLGCHGIDSYKNAYPNYSVPALEGQHPEYLGAALQEYRSGDRAHLTMHSQASTLSDQDIADIVAYFA